MTETALARLPHRGIQKFVPFLMHVGQRANPTTITNSLSFPAMKEI